MKSPTIKINAARQWTRHSTFPATSMRSSALILLLLAYIGVASKVEAVSPPPDGGYPGGNTAEGQAALFSLTTGSGNTAIGFKALLRNTTGFSNTANGNAALISNTTGEGNTAIGSAALGNNTTGAANVAVGAGALALETNGVSNTAVGTNALEANTTGIENTAIGDEALTISNGTNNSALGHFALFRNTTGNFNTAVGDESLFSNTTGNLNIAIGREAGGGIITADNVICIGSNFDGANVSNSCFIGNIRGVTTTNADAIPVLIDSAGQLGTASSSRRFKSAIKPMSQASESILALKPVTFHYKSDKTKTPQFGLIAEEVAEVNPDLVVRDKNGEIYTVRYDAVNAMLLNEFLKEHRRVGEQQATITHLQKDFQAVNAEQQKQIQFLRAELKEQAAQIQSVRVQIEVTKPASRMVLTNR
jgi:Chaperone of endosialidase